VNPRYFFYLARYTGPDGLARQCFAPDQAEFYSVYARLTPDAAGRSTLHHLEDFATANEASLHTTALNRLHGCNLDTVTFS